MKFKLSKLANHIDKFGLFCGTKIYLQLKFQRYTHIKIGGIVAPIYLRKNTSDTAIFDQVFLYEEYQITLNFTPSIIVDAGANIGLFAIFMKNKYPDSSIYCIEPSLDNFEILQKNIKNYSGIQTLLAGLWNSSTQLQVVDKFNMSFSALAVEENALHGSVPAITVDEFMATNKLDYIDVLKIDIEGSEQVLFASNYEVWLPKVRMIIIELHDWLLPNTAKPFFDAIKKTFKQYTYTVVGENTVIENLHFKYP
jgi:FkbM family methyltransferase